MKNLFLAIALTGFVGAASLNTVSAFAPSKVVMGGGEECKKDKKCKKGASCCKSKTTATAGNEKKTCSSGEAKKCCSSSKTQAKTTTGTAIPATSDTKVDSKSKQAVE